MQIEDIIFQKKKFIPKLLEEYGFTKLEDRFELKMDFMNGDFQAIIQIDEDGQVIGSVIDTMNNEEYLQLRVKNLKSEYVKSVRNAYEELLQDIVDKCCKEVLFVCEQANRITNKIIEKYNISPDFPWEKKEYQTYGIFRHIDTRKWFALIMDIKWKSLLKNKDERLVDVMNLKINVDDGDKLRAKKGIYPAYHMNKKHWITIVLDDSLTDDDVIALIQDSYNLTGKKKK